MEDVRDFRTGIPWFRVHNCIVRDYGKELGPMGVAVYATLCCHAKNKTQESFPRKKTIAELLGCSSSAVRRALRIMEKLGLLKTNPNFREDGSQTSNTYYLLDPPILQDAPPTSQGRGGTSV